MAEEENIYLTEGEEGGEEEASNRMFLFIMLGLGGLFICTLAMIGLYAFYIQPRAQQEARNRDATAIAHNLTVTAQIELASRATDTPMPTDTPAPTDTPRSIPTNTPVVTTPTFTPAPTETPGPVTATPTATPTRVVRTPTTVARSTGTPGAVGELSDTGVGGLGLILLAAGLVVILFIARRLRLSQQ